MASPQVENGFTRIANELLEAVIRAEMPAVQTRIVLIIMRETYGYQRKTVRMGYQALSTTYGIARTLLIREMAALVDRNVLVKESAATGNTWGVQKDYTQWLGSHSTVTSPLAETSHQNGQRLVTPERPVTSHSTVTTSKKEKERKKDDVARAIPEPTNTPAALEVEVQETLAELGFTDRQAKDGTLGRTWCADELPALREWFDARRGRKDINPTAILVNRILKQRLLPADLPRSNGHAGKSVHEMTTHELEAHMHGA